MNQKPAAVSDKITILVFKDHFAARTFQVPLRWISQFSILIGILITVTLASSLFAVRYYYLWREGDLSHVKDLDPTKGPKAESEIETEPEFKTEPNSEPRTEINANAEPASEVAPTPEPTHATPVEPLKPTLALFPESITGNLPPPSSLRFAITKPQAQWQNDTLKVQFTLQHQSASQTGQDPNHLEDHRSQQGRILILARGPQTLMTYPSTVFSPAGTPTLLSPSQGESFSVSRYRDVKASFGPFSSRDAIRDIEIYIFNKEGSRLLIYSHLEPQLGQQPGKGQRPGNEQQRQRKQERESKLESKQDSTQESKQDFGPPQQAAQESE